MRFIFFLIFPVILNAQNIQLDIKAQIDPAEGRLSAETEIYFPETFSKKIFFLNREFQIEKVEGGILKPFAAPENVKTEEKKSSYSSASAWVLTPYKGAKKFKISYSGRINSGFRQTVQEYSRSFSESDGIISSSGVYLSGASFFYPLFENYNLSFRAELSLPEGFSCAAPGARIEKKKGLEIWRENRPIDELTISCGKFNEYSIKDGKKNYYAFLLTPDRALAEGYLEAAQKYLNFYSNLIGKYPYEKFALVENFWETGYGLPSFTLLGSRVIRLPFIISSSYPHEILHNWWGNGVFVDYESGNWCEGLTVYLADYLIKDDKGKGREYRRDTLKKYMDYAAREKDFPLKDFISRHSSAQEAVGYGKGMMFYHMLRLKLGDELFLKGLREFYSSNLYRKASFENLREAFEKVSKKDLKPFFSQWIDRTGAARLALENVSLKEEKAAYRIDFTISQKGDYSYSDLQVPAVFYFEKTSERKVLELSSSSASWSFSFAQKPLAMAVDPDFEIFRKLSPLETPPSLSKILGEVSPNIILPCRSPDIESYESLAGSWNLDRENRPNIKKDCSLSKPPENSSSWYFGAQNKFAPLLSGYLDQYGAALNEKYFYDGKNTLDISSSTIVMAFYDHFNTALGAAYLISNSPSSLKTVAQKLPHYGKYSWLIFDRNGNISATGIWGKELSPLRFEFSSQSVKAEIPSSALAEIPSFISRENLRSHIEKLSAEIKERYPQTPGFEKARSYIISYLKKSGLQPFYTKYEQPFSFSAGGSKIKTSNIVAAVYGKSRKDEYIVLCAHYDHLKSDGALFYPGSNDNASGTALLLEMAKYYASRPAERTILFAFFSGEEEGRLGSKEFLKEMGEKSVKINAAINFDTLGALKGRKLQILNSDSSDKWTHIFRGAGFITQNDYELSRQPLDSSDQLSFIEKGVPAVQFFDGGDFNYHKPSDTQEKIDYKGIINAGELAREAVDYLAGESEFITRQALSAAAGNSLRENAGPRKVSTGMMPDFSFQGNGVRIQEIAAGSPLEKAGFDAGDIITAINSEKTPDLRSYSEILKNFKPGDRIKISYISSGKEKTAEIILDEKK